MKRTALLLLSVSIGFPAISVGAAAAVVCVTHSPEWQKFKAKISRPSHLDHKPSPATVRKWTAYNKAMLAKLDKQLEVLCAPIIGSDSGNSVDDFRLVDGRDVLAVVIPQAGDGMDLATETAQQMIQGEDYPTYANTTRDLTDTGDVFPSWGGGGGWIPVGYPPMGDVPSAPPVTPVPTPEPSTLALAVIGIAAGIWKVSRI